MSGSSLEESEDRIRPNSEAIMNPEFLDIELDSMIEHILDCLPGEELSLFYEWDKRTKDLFYDWKVELWQKHLLIKYP